MRAYHVTIGAYEFAATEEGPQTGPPVVLLHGFPQTSASWQAASRLLAAEGLRTIAPDQRGYSPGARPGRIEAYHVDRLVEDVIGLLDALHLPTVHLVGHDWGAIVAWHAAVAHPERFRTLTAVSVPHLRVFYEVLADPGPEGEEQRQRSAYVQLFRMEGKGRGRAAGEQRPLAPRPVLAAAGIGDPAELRGAEPTPGADRRAELVPRDRREGVGGAAERADPDHVRVVHRGHRDRPRGGRGLRTVRQGPYRFVELSGVSHWIPDQAPVELARAVVDRVRSVEN